MIGSFERGITEFPLDDRHSYSKEFLYNTLAILLGGRVAEELILKHITTGAGNDIERATDLARKMVCEWGMSEKLGPLTFGKKNEEIFLGREIATHRDFSDQVALEIDHEVKRLVVESYERRSSADILAREFIKGAGKRVGPLKNL